MQNWSETSKYKIKNLKNKKVHKFKINWKLAWIIVIKEANKDISQKYDNNEISIG